MAPNDRADEVQRELDVRVDLGQLASEDQLNQLLSIARQVELAPGEVLYREGATPTKLFRLVSGELELTGANLPSWRLLERGTVGFIDYMLARPHPRTATVQTTARVLELDAADYRDYLEDNFEICHRLTAQLARELVVDLVEGAHASSFLAQAAGAHARSFAKSEIAVVDRVIMLSQMASFRGASMQALADLAQSAVEVRYEPGDLIAAAGSRPPVVSVLVEGAVELALPGGARVTRAGRGFAGHAEELTIAPRLLSTFAASPTIVLEIEREELLDRVEEHFELAVTLFAFLASERDRLNHETARGAAWEASERMI